MINYSLVCKSNYWPARVKKIKLLIKKILNFQNELFFKKNIYYNCNIILADDKLVKKMNLKFRNIRNSTNVLTFVSEINLKKTKKQKMCDIFLSAEKIKKEATINNITFYNHLTHILIHSFLHINDFKHKKIKDFKKMKKIEIFVLKKLGISNPYILN